MIDIISWRRPAKVGELTPLVLLLHGRGADERDLIDLATRLPRSYIYASLRAHVPVDGGGFTWFENRGPARPIAASLRESVAGLRRWLDGPEATFPRAKVYVFGFSAGMMMAGALVLDDPERFAGAVLLSGALALDAMSQEAAPDRLAGLPIFYGRGTADDVIPADLVRRTESYLSDRSGANLTTKTYSHDHTISTREIDDIAAWFGERT